MKKPASQRKWVDISVTIRSGMVHWPSDPAVRVSRTKDISKGDSDNVSSISMGSHTGTHIDAPLHFFPGGKSLDKMPFGATIGPARVIAVKNKVSISPGELAAYRIKRGERIIFKTRNSNYWQTGKFNKSFVYISSDGAKHLVSKGISCVGIDYLSVGAYYKEGEQIHKIFLKNGVWIIEGLNLKGVLPGAYDLICLPLKIFNSEGAPARAIISPRTRA
jgi:arylformamidase